MVKNLPSTAGTTYHAKKRGWDHGLKEDIIKKIMYGNTSDYSTNVRIGLRLLICYVCFCFKDGRLIQQQSPLG